MQLFIEQEWAPSIPDLDLFLKLKIIFRYHILTVMFSIGMIVPYSIETSFWWLLPQDLDHLPPGSTPNISHTSRQVMMSWWLTLLCECDVRYLAYHRVHWPTHYILHRDRAPWYHGTAVSQTQLHPSTHRHRNCGRKCRAWQCCCYFCCCWCDHSDDDGDNDTDDSACYVMMM